MLLKYLPVITSIQPVHPKLIASFATIYIM